MKSFALVLLLSRAISSIRATEFSNEFEITKDLNDTIVEIFQTVEPQSMVNLIESLINSDTADLRTTPYTYYYTWNNGNTMKIRFYNLRLTQALANNSFTSYGFLSNQIQLHSTQCMVNLSGIWNLEHLYLDYHFNSEIRLSQCKISATRQQNTSSNSFIIDLNYSRMDIRTEGSATQFSAFRKPFEYFLPSILRTHMNRNENLSHVLSEIYDNQMAKHITKHLRFLDHGNRSHYSIPTAPIGSLNLRDIVIIGLSNYHTLSFTMTPNTIIYTLLMKDIRGRMILEDISRTESSTLELHYFIDSLTIIVTPEINRISVRAKNYSIVETRLHTSLTDIHSDVIMDRVERAIGSSIMPSMEFQRTQRSSHLLNRIEKENSLRELLTGKTLQSEENDIESPYNTWISNNKHLPTKSPQIVTKNYFTYHISFSNLTIVNFISGNQSPLDQVQCPLPDNSQFSYQMSFDPSSKSFRNNDEANSTDIKFNFNLSPKNVSVINVNDSMANNSCEFQISNDQDIEIHSSLSMENNTTESQNEHFLMKREIENALNSTAKERFILMTKSAVRSPFNFCMQYAKLMDEYFRNFINKILKKCSIRRNATQPN